MSSCLGSSSGNPIELEFFEVARIVMMIDIFIGTLSNVLLGHILDNHERF